MSFAYITLLIFTIFCLALIDWRYKLAFWRNTKKAFKTLLISSLFFVIWDFLGIKLEIFYHGSSNFSLPFVILLEFPLEEIFFIILLCYVTLIIYTGIKKWQST